MIMTKKKIIYYCILALFFVTQGCSTTKRIANDEYLYTGVKKVEIDSSGDSLKFPSSVKSQVDEAVNVAPNNCLISPSVRYPFPLGLWVYNNWNPDSKGLKGWLYRKLVSEPVLISDVRPEVRVKMIDEILDNNGFFQGSASYKLNIGKNPKKASITYEVVTGPFYPLDSIEYLPDSIPLFSLIDSIAKKDTYLQPGSRYCTDSLSVVRNRIANSVRNRGYYFFRPEFIEYLADSIEKPGRILLRLSVARNIPDIVLTKYRTGDITVVVKRHHGGGVPDTIPMRNCTLIQMQPSRLRKKIIPECLAFREGKTFSVRDMDRTQTYFSRLGIFNQIDIAVVRDTMKQKTDPRLNVMIECQLDAPIEASVEVNVSSKSNSYLGPGLVAGVTNRNIFGGGEQLSVRLNATYEWETGHEGSNGNVFNSYEFGLNTSLAFPRMLAPGIVNRRRNLNWTRINLGADLLNRPHYFKMLQFNTGFTYDWQYSSHVSNVLSLFKLTYTNLLHTTEAFDSICEMNPAIALSFQNTFIPQISYTYTYNRLLNYRNSINWTFTIQEAGNIFAGIWSLAGSHGEKKMFGTPFSQFLKGQTQFVYNHRFRRDDWLVTRILVGAAHAYGNSKQVPYSEQFYIGGANSIRAFTVRSIGPGSYRAPYGERYGYFDQTGTFKFEWNVEYRFPIIGILHGAVFLDSGNIWLLKNDPDRPGGKLEAKTFFKDLAVGTGFGLRVDISMFVIRGDLGIGIHAPYDTGKHGYYNMKSFGKSLAFHLAIGYPF